ncbi:ROK family transcriptional regulator [Catenuloplanes japonicus]|uniref:ROK family transcriptional regulator n=1 Tax=Catenuloplanes japonicus TaxID=33876 RepID=UPI0005275C62|nr:ROK family transcriptional regulator [Catenuloplanes japonicus]
MKPPEGVQVRLRRTHEESVLRVLREHGALSRGQIARLVGLSRTTLSEITGELLSRGAVVVTTTDAASRHGSGRPAELLTLDPTPGQFLGVDIGHSRVRVAIVDASHEVIAAGCQPYPADSGWAGRLEAALGLIDRLCRDRGVTLRALQAVAVGVVGPHPTTRRAEVAALRPSPSAGGGPRSFQASGRREAGQHGTGLRAAEPVGGGPIDLAGVPIDDGNAREAVADLFAARLGTPVLVDNNTRYAALAEALTDGPQAQDVMYVRLSDGIGGGLIVGGRLVSGGHGVAGEFGHVVVVRRGGEPCRCGKRGCLETVASLPAVLRRCGLADARALTEAVRKGDPAVRAVIDDVAERVGGVVAAAALVVNPDRIVLGGRLVRAVPHLVDAVAEILDAELISVGGDRPIVRGARLGDDDGTLGAVAALFRQTPLLAGYPETADPEAHRRAG